MKHVRKCGEVFLFHIMEEDWDAIMAIFLNGLNREIANIIKLHHYIELEDLVHMAIKVESQLKKMVGRANPSSGSTLWMPN